MTPRQSLAKQRAVSPVFYRAFHALVRFGMAFEPLFINETLDNPSFLVIPRGMPAQN